MAEEVVETETKAKKPIALIVGGIVAVLLLLVGTVVGTLFLTGAFKPKPELTAEQLLGQGASPADGHGAPADAHGAAAGGHGDAKKDGKKDGPPAKLSKKSPELTRFDFSYLQLEREFLTNLTGSRKVMSIQVAVMTRYDQRVLDNVKKHEFALRSVMMDVMRQTVDADLSKPDFRKELAVRLRDAMNTLLEKYEDFGGIEDVYFTSFIVQ
jgi:flagellar FliL protein